MKVALVFKAGVADTLKEKLIGIKDNLDMDCFDSVSKMANMAIKRNIVYDRVIFVANLVSDADMNNLRRWWGSVSDKTELVMLARKDMDKDITDVFCDTFVSPLVAVMLLDKPTVKLVADAVILKTSEINSKYGMGDLIQVEVERDFEYTPEPVEQPKVEEPKVEQKKSEPKKQGFMSKLFGGKSKQAEPPKPTQPQPQEQTYQEDYQQEQEDYPMYEEQTYQDDYTQAQDSVYGQVEESYPIQEEQTYQQEQVSQEPFADNLGGMPEFPNPQQFECSDSDSVTTQIPVQQTPLVQPMTPEQFMQTEPVVSEPFVDETFTENNDFSSVSEVDGIEVFSDDLGMVDEDFSQSLVEEPMFEEPQASIPTQPSYVEPVQPTNPQVINNIPVSPQPTPVTPSFVVEEVDEDFSVGFEGYSEPQKKQGVDVVEVDMSMTGMDLSSAEEAYRQKAKEKDTVVKVVEKEVIKEVNKGYNLLGSVLKGRQRKIIVVTGDRATGVTSTALTLAEMFSKHVKVLYFDCDIKNHGILSYIDYDTYRDYEEIHMQGTKLCKNSKAFKNCVCSLAHNLDFLMTDYSCDVTTDELENAQGIVSEYSGDYGVVIVDCPVENLQYIPDLVMTGVGIICVEGSKRGIMNMLCQFELSTLSLRYKRNLASKGTMLMTKCTKQVDVPKLLREIREMFTPDGVDWFDMRIRAYNGGKISDKLLNEILEQ